MIVAYTDRGEGLNLSDLEANENRELRHFNDPKYNAVKKAMSQYIDVLRDNRDAQIPSEIKKYLKSEVDEKLTAIAKSSFSHLSKGKDYREILKASQYRYIKNALQILVDQDEYLVDRNKQFNSILKEKPKLSTQLSINLFESVYGGLPSKTPIHLRGTPNQSESIKRSLQFRDAIELEEKSPGSIPNKDSSCCFF